MINESTAIIRCVISFLLGMIVATVLFTSSADAACYPNFYPNCLHENTEDIRAGRDECRGDYYYARSECHSTYWSEANCRKDARDERTQCYITVKDDRQFWDAWCYSYCLENCPENCQ